MVVEIFLLLSKKLFPACAKCLKLDPLLFEKTTINKTIILIIDLSKTKQK